MIFYCVSFNDASKILYISYNILKLYGVLYFSLSTYENENIFWGIKWKNFIYLTSTLDWCSCSIFWAFPIFSLEISFWCSVIYCLVCKCLWFARIRQCFVDLGRYVLVLPVLSFTYLSSRYFYGALLVLKLLLSVLFYVHYFPY